MSDMIANGMAWLGQQMLASAAQTVTFARGTVTVDISATIGRTEYEVDGGTGVLVRIQSRDYLVAADDLILDGELIFPARGDKITEHVGTTDYVYVVAAMPGQSHYQWADHARAILRIHTKEDE